MSNQSGGLLNLGNTCAINTLIQCIYACTSLRNILLHSSSKNNSITTELIDIITKLSQGHSLSPKGFVHKLYTIFNHILSPGEECDIGELWLLLGEKISDEFNIEINTNEASISNIDASILKMNNNKDSDWQNAIQGVNICITKCNNCNENIINTDIFTILTLDLSTNIEITDMLLSFFKVEELSEWKCDKCNKQGCRKQYQIYKLPKVLVILIKRFNNNSVKLENPVNILPELNINNNSYKLKSVGNHFGNYHGGHYTAATLTDKWRYYDDISIHNIDIDIIMNNNTYAYILFYERE